MANFDQLITFLKVDDLSRSLRFYNGLLQLPQIYARDDKVVILQVNETSFIGLVPGDLPAATPRSSALTFLIKDVDAWLPRLEAAGVPNKGKPIFKPEFGIYVLYATDPDGNTVEFMEMRDPAWPQPKRTDG